MIYLIKKNENLDYKNLGTEFEKFLKPVSQFVDRLDTNEIKMRSDSKGEGGWKKLRKN